MPSRITIGSQIKAIRAGLKTGLPAGTTSLTVGNVSYSIPDLDKALATEESYYDNASAAHVASQAAVRERDARVGTARALVDDFKSAIRGLLGTQNETLLQFGVKPKKAARKLTADEKALAAARNRATRKARGTVGPRARAAIHGADVTQVTVSQAPTPPPKTA